MTHSKNNPLLKEWVKRLGLTDWKIKLFDHCRSDEMSMGGCAGCVEYREVGKTARIDIIDEKEYGNRIVLFDYEKTLVHELLHLKMCFLASTEDGFGDDNIADRMAHQLLDDIAKALVDAKRKGDHHGLQA